MATSTASQTVARGGSFLVENPRPEDIFTAADINDEQKLIGQTTEEFINDEVVPVIPELEAHKEGVMVSLVKKSVGGPA